MADQELRTVAALYVEPNGVYSGLDGVDCWPESRDARLYGGPHPVVSHPPCNRWSLMSACRNLRTGEDGGCAAASIASVRNHGGVMEHPAYSLVWRWFGLLQRPAGGGWVWADWLGGWTCSVEQGHYGHECPKATWLYAVGCDLPSLAWGGVWGRWSSRELARARLRWIPAPPGPDPRAVSRHPPEHGKERSWLTRN